MCPRFDTFALGYHFGTRNRHAPEPERDGAILNAHALAAHAEVDPAAEVHAAYDGAADSGAVDFRHLVAKSQLRTIDDRKALRFNGKGRSLAHRVDDAVHRAARVVKGGRHEVRRMHRMGPRCNRTHYLAPRFVTSERRSCECSCSGCLRPRWRWEAGRLAPSVRGCCCSSASRIPTMTRC